ncbi:putative polysaccharide export-assoiated protein [Oceanicola granulosus HTCC2516]|uniref:Putative polysaccharide export-assoiated protein n=1 Tax=Oceanicola granulosus (strain ATCC BAA-861 / DSM 15982 / KCTC 12143 / HTCC2516) TaxID=314256 RepID=Q2C9U4_OCEGH|nr:hypothetical protein [Oceanicola granulosus]EAR49442.1 putative polysaccharide export-assoiated protein [Oceanicola granulosus HTCC2516]
MAENAKPERDRDDPTPAGAEGVSEVMPFRRSAETAPEAGAAPRAAPAPPPETPAAPAAAEPAAEPPAAKPAETEPSEKNSSGSGSGRKRRSRRDPPQVVEVAPVAKPARMRKRHWGIIFAFLLVFALPLAGVAWYLWERAVDQYASTVGFTVRQEQGGSASELLGGLSQLTGVSGGSTDTDILYEFMQSQALVGAVHERLDLIEAYSGPYAQDPVFALAPDAGIEELTRYWRRIVRISYDQASGLMELRVLAFDADTAQAIAREILAQSQVLINELNATARNDTLRYAEADLATAVERVKEAREALTLFRTRTRIVDPETDVQGQTALINNLQQQLAAALIEYDLLTESTSDSDPRVTQAQRRIEVIEQRIAAERESTVSGDEYPQLLAEYESLVVDREFAEESYRAALAALDAARANASRQTRYLAAYVAPTLPQVAEYPRRLTLLGLAAGFLFLFWAVMSLIYYSIRDSR